MRNRLSALMVSTAPYALNAGGEGGGGAPPAPAAPAAPADPATILFGGDKPTEPPADPAKPVEPPAPKADDQAKPADKPAEWKEYENDPAKSAEENARLKAEHDATKPKDDDKKADADKVPTDGKYDLKMPDGVELDKELADAIGPEFASLNLTNAQAQKLVDKYIEVEQARATKRLEGWGQTVDKWADDAKADKEIGGTNWDSSVSDAKRAIETLGTPALKEYLQASGGGNHPELIRVFAKVGKLVKEDAPPAGGSQGLGKPADAAHVLFPNDAPKG